MLVSFARSELARCAAMKSMPPEAQVIWEGFVSLLIPEPWESGEDEGVMTIFNPNGVGALQISFAKSVAPTIDLEELTEKMSRDVGLKTSSRPTTVGSVWSTYVEGVSGEGEPTYWRIWHIAGRDRVACVTYNCAPSNAGVETESVDRVLASWTWLA
jgi:hypothetical protein